MSMAHVHSLDNREDVTIVLVGETAVCAIYNQTVYAFQYVTHFETGSTYNNKTANRCLHTLQNVNLSYREMLRYIKLYICERFHHFLVVLHT